MSRPLSNQAGHAYAPGVEIPREPNPLVQILEELVEIALPAILLLALLFIMLMLLRLIVSTLRRRRAARREAEAQRAWMEEAEEEAAEDPRRVPTRSRFAPRMRREV